MAIPSKFGDYYKSQLPTINFIGTTSTSSSKTNWGEIAGGIAGYGLGIFAEVMAAKQTSGGGTGEVSAEQVKENANLAYLATKSGSSAALSTEISNLKSAQQKLKELTDIQDGTTENNIKEKEAQINAINTEVQIPDENGSMKTVDIATVLNNIESAKSGLESLKQQKTIDDNQMNTLQESINSYNSAQAIKLPSGKQIDPNLTAEQMQTTYANDANNYEVKSPPQAPVKEKLTKAEGETDTQFEIRKQKAEQEFKAAQTKFKEDSEKYTKYLEYQSQKASVDALAQQKQQVDDNKKTLSELQNKYKEGGVYETTKASYEKEIAENQKIIDNNPDKVADATKKNNLSKDKAVLEAQLQAYKPQKQTVTTTEKDESGKEKKVSKEVSTGPNLNSMISSLNTYIKEQSQLVTKLQTLDGLNTQLEGQEKLDSDLNKNDGNWLTRLFSKKDSTKRTNRATRKTNQGLMDTTKERINTLSKQILVQRQSCYALYQSIIQ